MILSTAAGPVLGGQVTVTCALRSDRPELRRTEACKAADVVYARGTLLFTAADRIIPAKNCKSAQTAHSTAGNKTVPFLCPDLRLPQPEEETVPRAVETQIGNHMAYFERRANGGYDT